MRKQHPLDDYVRLRTRWLRPTAVAGDVERPATDRVRASAVLGVSTPLLTWGAHELLAPLPVPTMEWDELLTSLVALWAPPLKLKPE